MVSDGLITCLLRLLIPVFQILVGLLAVFELDLLIICFAKKHQSLAIILSRHIVPKWFFHLFYVFCFCNVLILSILGMLLKMTKEEEFMYIQKVRWSIWRRFSYSESLQNHPEYLESFKSLHNFDIFKLTLGTTSFVILVLIEAFLLAICFLCFTIDTFHLLVEVRTRIAAATYQKHQEGVRNFMVQLITSMLSFSSICMFVMGVLTKLNGIQCKKTSVELISYHFFSDCWNPYLLFYQSLFPQHYLPYHLFPTISQVFRELFQKVLFLSILIIPFWFFFRKPERSNKINSTIVLWKFGNRCLQYWKILSLFIILSVPVLIRIRHLSLITTNH